VLPDAEAVFTGSFPYTTRARGDAYSAFENPSRLTSIDVHLKLIRLNENKLRINLNIERCYHYLQIYFRFNKADKAELL